MPEEPFESIKKHQFIALSTFRKSGQEVITPVWFVNQGSQLYVWTGKTSGKVKRIRNNPRVRLVPSDFRGTPRGNWVEGTASIHEQGENTEVEQLFRKKYGLQFKLFSGLGQGRGSEVVFLMIQAPRPGLEPGT